MAQRIYKGTVQMTQQLIKPLSPSAQAFSAVMEVGRDFANRIEEAQIAGDTVAESLAVSIGMIEMQDAITQHAEAKKIITRSMGHAWGFKTDKDTQATQYSESVVIGAFCHAALTKLSAVGNEWNIIAAAMYVTKNGWQGKLARLPGVTEIDIATGAIRESEEKEYITKVKTNMKGEQYGGEEKTKLTAFVSATASCKVWGQLVEVRAWKTPDGQDERYQLSGTGETVEHMIDQLRGKAEARISERLFMKVVGLSHRGLHQPAELPAATIAVTAPLTRPAETENATSTLVAEPIPFAEQIEAATKSRDLDTIARAIKAANLPDDEFSFYKAMVTEARKRLTEAEVAT
jgi:hypothetical protein